MGVALFLLLNISQPRRLIQLNKVSYIASRTLAENTQTFGIPRQSSTRPAWRPESMARLRVRIAVAKGVSQYKSRKFKSADDVRVGTNSYASVCRPVNPATLPFLV
jgi:hypothetical protein